MFTLTAFSQSTLLQGETDPDIRNGICVALCDYWLSDVKQRSRDRPEDRLNRLAANYPTIAQYQKQYGQQRALHGPEHARRQMGQQLGHDFRQHTTIMPAMLGAAGIRQRLAADLKGFGTGATWSMRFPDDTGHAIAGYYAMITKGTNINIASLRLFDPNIGEYVGGLHDLDSMLADLLTRFPLYLTVCEIRRTTDR